MIFKTITDDVTGANKSIGLFGLSLQNVSNKLQEIKRVGFKEAVFNSSKIDAKAINAYNARVSAGIPAEDALRIVRKKTNAETIALIQSNNGLIVSEERVAAAQKASTLAARAQSNALKAVSIAANMITYALIAKGIQLIADAIDHSVNRAKYAKEALKDAKDEIKSVQDSLQQTTSTVSEVKERFLELSKGVDSFSNNLRLSEEDYAEYLSISNKLAEISPSLVSGYDDQGNALLEIGNNAQETNKKLQELLETQKESTKQTLVDNMSKIASGVAVEVKQAKDKIFSLKNELDDLENDRKNKVPDLLNVVNNNGGFIQFDNYSVKNYEEYIKNIEKALSSAGVDFTENKNYNGIQIDSYKNDEQLKQAESFINTYLEKENNFYYSRKNGLEKSIKEQEKLLSDHYKEMNASLQAWVQSNYDYQYLGMDNDYFQNMIDKLIPQIDWNNISETQNLDSEIGYQDYIQKNIIDPLMKIPEDNKDEIAYMFNQLLSFEDGDLNVIPFAEKLKERLDELGITIDITPIIADEKEIQKKIDNNLRTIAGADGNNIAGFSVDEYNKLSEYTSKLTSEQKQAWLSVTNGIDGADNAIKAFEDSLKNAKPDKVSLSEWLDVEKNKNAVDGFKEQIEKIQGYLNDIENISNDELLSIADELGNQELLNIDLSKPEGIEEFRKALQELETNELSNLIKMLKQDSVEGAKDFKQALEDMVAGVNNSGMSMDELKNKFESSRSSMAELKQVLYDMGHKDERGNDYINTIASKYPELLQYIDDEAELRKQVNQKIEEQKQIAAQAYTDMMSDSDEYYDSLMKSEETKVTQINNSVNSIIKSNAVLVNTLGKNYKVDLNNFQNIVNAKGKLEQQLIKNSASAWAKYYKVQVNASTGLAEATQKHVPIETDEHGVPVIPQERVDAYNAANDAANAYNKAITELNNLSNTVNIPIVTSGTNSDKNDKNKKKAEKFNENIDWAAQSISVLTSNLQKLQSELDNTEGYEKQIAKLKEIYKTNQSLTQSYKKNYQAYSNYYNKLKNKYSDTYKKYGAKIENGETFSIENFKGKGRKKTYDQIQKLIEAYGNKIGAKNDYENQKSSEKQSYIDLYQKRSDHQNDIIESKKAQLENTNSYSKQKKLIDGIMSATAKKLEYDLKIADTQIEKNKLLQEYLSTMQELAKLKVDDYWQKKDEKREKYQNTNDVLNAQVDNVDTAHEKNILLNQVLENDKAETKNLQSDIKNAKSERSKEFAKINDEYKKNLDEDGNIIIDNLKNIPEDQLNRIVNYNAWNESINEKEPELQKRNQEIKKNRKDTQIQKANNIVEEIDNKISLIESKQKDLENYKNLTEAKGNTVAKAYYKDQMAYEQQSLDKNKALEKDLKTRLAKLKPGTREWYEVYKMLQNCNDSIADSALNMQNFANEIKKIDLSVFENLKDEFETITGEANFLIELMSDADMNITVDDTDIKQLLKNGDFKSIQNMFSDKSPFANLTDEGMSTVALYGANYNTYMNEAYEIQKKRNELAKEMAEDESKNTEENKKQLQEWDEQYRQSILNAKKEGKSAMDIVKQGYTEQLNILKQIIDMKKQSLDAEKKLYDYQKNVKKQTKDIASLQQQYDAWSKIDTEEAKNKTQQLKVELEDAQTSLEETIYDQYISDLNELYDEMYDDYEDLINNALKNTDIILTDILEAVNKNEGGILETLVKFADEWGIELPESMKKIFNPYDGKNALDTDSNASTAPDTTTGTGTVTQESVDNANNEQSKKEQEYRNKIQEPLTVTIENASENSYNPTDDIDIETDTSSDIDLSAVQTAVEALNNKKTELLSGAINDTSKDNFSNGNQTLKSSIADLSTIKRYINNKATKTDTPKNKLSSLNRYIYDKTNGKILSKKEISTLGNKYLDVKTSDNPTAKQKTAILKALKKAGYSKGGFAEDINKVVKANGDDGIATIQRKELVLTKVQTNDYMKLMDNIDNLNNMFDYSSMVKDFQNNIQKTNTNTTNQISAEFHFNLPNVTDTNSFLKAIQNDSNVQRAIQNVTVGRLGGSGKLSVNRIK